MLNGIVYPANSSRLRCRSRTSSAGMIRCAQRRTSVKHRGTVAVSSGVDRRLTAGWRGRVLCPCTRCHRRDTAPAGTSLRRRAAARAPRYRGHRIGGDHRAALHARRVAVLEVHRHPRWVKVAGLSRRLFVCQNLTVSADPTAFANSSVRRRRPSVIYVRARSELTYF